MRREGLEKSLNISTADPLMPHSMEDPVESGKIMESYAEWVLRHGESKGVKMEGFEWDRILDGDNCSLL
ncbi:MAG: hypothetical protein ABEJ07_02570 [Candidatus Nanohaloarchaea archaeon]